MDALGDTAFGSDYEHLLQHKEQEDQEAHISVLQFADSTIRVMDDNCHSDKKYTFFKDDLIQWLESGCKTEAPMNPDEINQLLRQRPHRNC